MKELFDPANFVWIIPLCAFGVLIILLTCFALRKEIRAMVEKLLFPYKNRYSMPAGIITKGSMPKDAAQTSYAVMKENAGLQEVPLLLTPLNPHDLPAAAAEPVKEQQEEEVKPHQAMAVASTEESSKEAQPAPQEKQEEKPISSVSKLRAFIKDFNAILFPQAQSCFSPKQDAAQNNVIDPNMTLPPVPPTPAEIKEEIQKQTEQKPKREPTKIKLDILDVPAPAAQPKAEEKAKGPYFMKDRYIIIFALLVLSGFVIFLTARVKLLSAIQQRQYIQIKQLQEQLSDAKGGNTGKKVIIYVPIGSNRIQK